MCGIIVGDALSMNDGWSIFYEDGICGFAFDHELELINESW
jgi:hypothetical protein